MNSSRFYLERFVRRASQSVPPGSRVLDAGAGDAQYRELFAQHQYESADFQQVDKPYHDNTYVCDLAKIPVESSRYDLVLMTQVLEHLPEPFDVLRELRRVLRPDGTLYLSCPLYFEEHEKPYDFYRFTTYGLRHLLGKAGFHVVEIAWLEGYLGTISHQLKVASWASPRGLRFLVHKASELLAHADTRYKVVGRGHPINYTAVAKAVSAVRE